MFNQAPFMMTNPLYQSVPSTVANTSKGLGFLSKINWSSMLTNTQKVLNVANQAIPLYHQVKPMISNIKTLGKIGRELANTTIVKENNINNNVTPNNINTNINKKNEEESYIPFPTFFI